MLQTDQIWTHRAGHQIGIILLKRVTLLNLNGVFLPTQRARNSPDDATSVALRQYLRGNRAT